MDEDTTKGKKMKQDEELSTFLAAFPAQLHYMPTVSYDEIDFPHFPDFDAYVFWTQNELSHTNSSSDVPNPLVIHDKIKSGFSEIYFMDRFSGIIQFWAPIKIGGRSLLTTCDQPFILDIEYLDPKYKEYRLSSMRYQYDVDMNNLEVEVKEDPMIICGAVADAFIDHLPKVIMDLKVQQENPLVRSALECNFAASLMLPVFDPSQNSCVGVVECTMKDSDFPDFIQLTGGLQEVGLSTLEVSNFWPSQATYCLRETIEEALQMVCESHDLFLAQVWVKSNVPFSSSFKDTDSATATDTDSEMKRMLALKRVGYTDDDCLESIDYYSHTCDVLPLKMGEGLVGKTLETYEAHFCKNSCELTDNEVRALLPADIQCSCVVICLKSIITGDLEYAFEFLWLYSRNHLILLEALLSTLKRCLPSFKLASGAEIGDELHVVDVENSKGTVTEFFKIFKGNKISAPIPETRNWMREKCKLSPCNVCKTLAIELPQEEDVKQQCGGTLEEEEEAVKNHNVSVPTSKRKCNVLGISQWQEPKFVMRKLDDDVCETQNNSNQDNYIAKEEPLVNINNKQITRDKGVDLLMVTTEVEMLREKVQQMAEREDMLRKEVKDREDMLRNEVKEVKHREDSLRKELYDQIAMLQTQFRAFQQPQQ